MTKIPTDFNFFYPPSLLTFDWSLYRIQKLLVEPSCTVSIACEQALHLEESGEKHAKGNASARGVERTESFPFLCLSRLRCLLARSRAASFACLRACSQATVSIVISTRKYYILSFIWLLLSIRHSYLYHVGGCNVFSCFNFTSQALNHGHFTS